MHSGLLQNTDSSRRVNGFRKIRACCEQLLTLLPWPVRQAVRCPGFHRLTEIPLNWQHFFGQTYPRNHTFVLRNDCLLPNPRLARRVAALSRLYPRPLGRLVDLSCSKGYFVFHARHQAGFSGALGVDIDETSVNACRELATRCDHGARIEFARLRLTELASSLEEHGGPFDTALLVNTYQYLRLGSEREPAAATSHRELFALLHQICRGRLIFHNRLSFRDLQQTVRDRTCAADARDYSPEAILAAADEFFTIRRASFNRVRPILVMDNRSAAVSQLAVSPVEILRPSFAGKAKQLQPSDADAFQG